MLLLLTKQLFGSSFEFVGISRWMNNDLWNSEWGSFV